MMPLARRATLLGLLLAGLAAPIASAGDLEVAPTTVKIGERNHSAVFYVTNRGADPVSVQVEALDWSQAAGQDILTPSETLIASPPMAVLAPGQRQVVRLLAQPRTGGTAERAFRLIVSELPAPGAPEAQRVRVLLQFSVPVFETPAKASEAALAWSASLEAGKIVLTANNPGDDHVQLLDAVAVAPDGRRLEAGLPTLSYVLGGATRQWTVNSRGLVAGDGLTIRRREAAGGQVLDTSVVIHP
jgi:fimbrial chaperone protein